jgi:CRP-like cAMP-binding protein
MSEGGKRLSILLVECSLEAAEPIISELGLVDWRADTCDDARGAMGALRGQKHYDLILTSYEGSVPDELELLRQVNSLEHRKHTPVVMIARKAEADRKMSERGKARGSRRRRHGLTDQMKALAASSLANKVGYLRVEDFPDQKPFGDLPTQVYGPHKIIRCRKDDLLLVTRGLVEVWHTNQDLLVKQLMIGALFGEMPLLGQTMVITQAISGPAGATVAVMNTERVRELIEANALALAETLYPRLASVDAEHYRAVFQAVESRVAALLLELAGDGASVEGLTQRQLGERMALVRETITAAVSSLKARKLIGVDHRRTTIFNRKALEQLSRS